MTYYLIRHIKTKQFMPQAKKNRGYSNWNPGNPNADEFTAALDIPRLIGTRKKAQRCIDQWNCIPNGHSDYDGDTKIKLDDRKKEDLEIVEIELSEESKIDFAIKVLKNYGADVGCGSCMEIAFTGVTTNQHSCKEIK